MAAYAMTNKNGFEIETCSRCGCTGEYSFNLMHGTTCFRCHGHKTIYTKRGFAAHQYYERLLTIPLEKLQVGMRVWVTGVDGKGAWGVVKSIDGNRVQTHLVGLVGYKEFRIRPTDGERQEALAKALAYQDTLTKLGKPKKGK